MLASGLPCKRIMASINSPPFGIYSSPVAPTPYRMAFFFSVFSFGKFRGKGQKERRN